MAKKSGKDSAISRREAIPLAATSGTKSLTSCRSRFRSGSALANESDHDPPTHTEQHPGISAALNYPLFKAIFNRRSRRVMKGTKNVHAGAMSYTSNQSVVPLDSYEEAMLIALCCKTGFSMPDRPFQ
ncbi:MAG: hypothetical protein NTV34_11605, partial [Proteobacteria bacterium]|nr:hypothetical protein [Pseudomonadota bacterium]